MTKLDKALAQLRRKTWVQGEYEQLDSHGGILGYCSVGAIRSVTFVNKVGIYEDRQEDQVALACVIREQFPERINAGLKMTGDVTAIITQFNDCSETTFQDIEMVFEKAYINSSTE